MRNDWNLLARILLERGWTNSYIPIMAWFPIWIYLMFVIPFLVESKSSHRPYVRKEKFYKLATADFAAAYGKVDGSVTTIACKSRRNVCHDMPWSCQCIHAVWMQCLPPFKANKVNYIHRPNRFKHFKQRLLLIGLIVFYKKIAVAPWSRMDLSLRRSWLHIVWFSQKSRSKSSSHVRNIWYFQYPRILEYLEESRTRFKKYPNIKKSLCYPGMFPVSSTDDQPAPARVVQTPDHSQDIPMICSSLFPLWLGLTRYKTYINIPYITLIYVHIISYHIHITISWLLRSRKTNDLNQGSPVFAVGTFGSSPSRACTESVKYPIFLSWHNDSWHCKGMG